MRVVLISTYELGRQPFGLASAAAWLRRAGAEVRCIDLSRDPLDSVTMEHAHLVAIHVPMHTATRLAVPVIERVRRENPSARLVAYGLYAPPNEQYLRALGVHVVLGPEAEADLVALASGEDVPAAPFALPRLPFITPDRPACRRWAGTRRCGSPPANDAWRATRRQRAAASTAAGTVRSCRCTTGSSAWCRPTRCSATFAPR